jgi:hypothetical protein
MPNMHERIRGDAEITSVLLLTDVSRAWFDDGSLSGARRWIGLGAVQGMMIRGRMPAAAAIQAQGV